MSTTGTIVARTPEGRVKDEIKKVLNALANCWWFLPGANGYGQHGIPDFIVCYRGVFIAIEVKAPGKLATGVTPLQQMQIRSINQAMGYAIAVDDAAPVRALIHDIDVRLKFQGSVGAERV